MKRILKKCFSKTIILILALMMCLPQIACNDNPTVAKASDVEFWSTWATEKILRERMIDKDGGETTKDRIDMYDNVKETAKIDVTAVKGEVESAQIIMTTGDKKVAEYEVSVTDLATVDGEVFDSENVTVYHQKYLLIEGPGEHYLTPGYYPDAIVPFENIKWAGENYVNAYNNQGLYVSFDIPEEQQTGVYYGTMKITIGGEDKNVPITLSVGYSSITEETHALSEFSTKWYYHRGELDYTQEMFDAYNYKMFEYRCGVGEIIYQGAQYGTTDAEIQRYAEKACEYSKDPRCCGFAIPRIGTTIKQGDLFSEEICYEGGKYYDLWSPNGQYLNTKRFMKTLKAFFYEGLKQNVDPFEKAYALSVDEPDLRGLEKMPPIISYLFKCCKDKVLEELRADQSVKTAENAELIEKMLNSLEGVHLVCTSSTYLSYGFDLETEDMVYCPEYHYLNTEYNLERYRIEEDNDLWWYGTLNPDNPYPTYHLDDTLLSARLLSWMQRDYNIQGNLYWAVNCYAGGTNGSYGYGFLEDYYNDLNGYYGKGTYGDGKLVYPGKKYNIYGPVMSLRMEAIRDGQEEHEFWYYLQEKYAELSNKAGIAFDDELIMNKVTEMLYSGTKVNTTNEVFANSRTQLIALLDLANAGVAITNVQEVSGNYVFKIFADQGVVPNLDGLYTINKEEVAGTGKLYTVTVQPGQPFSVQLSIGEYTAKFTLDVGSSSEVYDAEYYYENNIITRRMNTSSNTPNEKYNWVETHLVDATTVNPDAKAGEKYMQLYMQRGTDYCPQGFDVRDDETLGRVNRTTHKVTLGFYNACERNLIVDILVMYKDQALLVPYLTDVLKPGINYYTLNNLWAVNWTKFKGIRKIYVRIYETDEFGNSIRSPERDDIYFVNMSVYQK